MATKKTSKLSNKSKLLIEGNIKVVEIMLSNNFHTKKLTPIQIEQAEKTLLLLKDILKPKN